MAGFSYNTNANLVRTQIWQAELKEALLDDVFASKYVDWISMPDGDTLNIPSIGQFEARDYAENQAVTYSAMDTGNFQFSIDQYKQTGTFITERMKQDSFYAAKLQASFVPKQQRAIAKAVEAKILDVGPSSQTASNLNTINGGDHRFVASGTNQVIALKDFARARYALQKANVPMTNLVAIVDPSVGYALDTNTNLTSVAYNPMWEGIITSGISTGMKFIRNVYGFDVYVSQNLKASAGETINSVTVNSSGVHNLLFSASSDVVPFIGCMKQAPKVDTSYNKDFQREEYVVTCRYGVKLYRPENLVVLLSATDQIN